MHPHGGSELNDSRHAIQIVQRGRVRHRSTSLMSTPSFLSIKVGGSARTVVSLRRTYWFRSVPCALGHAHTGPQSASPSSRATCSAPPAPSRVKLATPNCKPLDHRGFPATPSASSVGVHCETSEMEPCACHQRAPQHTQGRLQAQPRAS